MTKKQTYRQFTGEEIIADVLLDFPEAHEILAAHGIACAGCHINQYETLHEGVVAHYGEDMFFVVIKDLNDAARELKLPIDGQLEKKDPIITNQAKEKILQFQKESDKKGFGLRIEITQNHGEVSHFLDFEEKPERGDKVITSNNIQIFCDPDSCRWLHNKKIDYKVEGGEEGFKFEEI